MCGFKIAYGKFGKRPRDIVCVFASQYVRRRVSAWGSQARRSAAALPQPRSRRREGAMSGGLKS
jgi:hypothetical protein